VPVTATGRLPLRVRVRFNGILWRFRTGSGWRDVPERYGPWSTVYSRFNARAKAGVFQTLMEALTEEKGLRRSSPQFQAAQHRRTLLPADQGIARPGHSLRQDTAKLRGRTASAEAITWLKTLTSTT
jgi:transposase